MIVTTWTCDKCGKAQDDPKDMWEIGIHLRRVARTDPYCQPKLALKGLWCQACVEDAGLVVPHTPPKNPRKPDTLEDLIREIVVDEMEAGE